VRFGGVFARCIVAALRRLAVTHARLTLRVDFGSKRSIGPGKIRLLEEIGRSGSISQAGRSLGMSYRRAWLLIDDLNRCFRQAVVRAKSGGSQGGGAALTEFGAGLVRDYRAIESAAAGAARTRLRRLETALRNARTAAAPAAPAKRTPTRRAKV
jgi:molybdate transport system regulatory protein